MFDGPRVERSEAPGGRPEITRIDTARHPVMHKTATVDYIILISGRVTMLLDRGQVDLEPGDVVVQHDTNHAWVNRGAEPAVLAGILVDAEPV